MKSSLHQRVVEKNTFSKKTEIPSGHSPHSVSNVNSQQQAETQPPVSVSNDSTNTVADTDSSQSSDDVSLMIEENLDLSESDPSLMKDEREEDPEEIEEQEEGGELSEEKPNTPLHRSYTQAFAMELDKVSAPPEEGSESGKTKMQIRS